MTTLFYMCRWSKCCLCAHDNTEQYCHSADDHTFGCVMWAHFSPYVNCLFFVADDHTFVGVLRRPYFCPCGRWPHFCLCTEDNTWILSVGRWPHFCLFAENKMADVNKIVCVQMSTLSECRWPLLSVRIWTHFLLCAEYKMITMLVNFLVNCACR